ncbi:MAG: carboxypeptidase-like regulatory domain-containing protein [Candidatus Sulfotelmatobacter sp.]
MRSGFRVVTVMLWLGCFLGLSVSAFSQSATSSLRGTITDTKGLVVAGAMATLSNAATGFSRSTTTNDQGIYQFLEIPPAGYVLTVTAAGFATTKRENVVLEVSTPATVNLTLQVQGG